MMSRSEGCLSLVSRTDIAQSVARLTDRLGICDVILWGIPQYASTCSVILLSS